MYCIFFNIKNFSTLLNKQHLKPRWNENKHFNSFFYPSKEYLRNKYSFNYISLIGNLKNKFQTIKIKTQREKNDTNNFSSYLKLSYLKRHITVQFENYLLSYVRCMISKLFMYSNNPINSMERGSTRMLKP